MKTNLNQTFALIVFTTLLVGCSDEMRNDARLKPLESSLQSEQSGLSGPIAGTVPRGHLQDDDEFFRGKTTGEFAARIPLEVNAELIAHGRERYEIFCAVCHGPTGEGNGKIVERGFPRPAPFSQPRLAKVPPGYVFDAITRGYKTMLPMDSMIPAHDRWAIVAFIETLHSAKPASVASTTP